MRRCVVAAAICCAAGAIALSGCSSSVDGAAHAGSTVAAPGSAAPPGTVLSGPRTSVSRTATAIPGVPGSVLPASPGAQESVGSVPEPDSGTGLPFGEPPPSQAPAATNGGSPASPTGAGLDDVSARWFTTYCRGLSEIAQYNSLNTTGLALPALTEARVAAYSGISLGASTTVGILQATQPPTFVGGPELEASVVRRFSVFADVYGRAALSLQAAAPQTEAELQAAVSAIEQEAAASVPDSTVEVDPAVLTAAKQLPDCQAVLN